jgi:hypothetical protein
MIYRSLLQVNISWSMNQTNPSNVEVKSGPKLIMPK